MATALLIGTKVTTSPGRGATKRSGLMFNLARLPTVVPGMSRFTVGMRYLWLGQQLGAIDLGRALVEGPQRLFVGLGGQRDVKAVSEVRRALAE
jgi:hypothetical protein